jgi:MFS family permease
MKISWQKTGRYCLAAMGMDCSNGMLLIFLPFIAMELGAGSLILGILGAARGLSYAIASPVSGNLSDKYNRKLLITISAAGILIAFIAIITARNLLQLFIPVICWTIVLSLFWPSLFSWLADAHHHRQLGKATGLLNMSWSIGLTFGGLIAGLLYEWIGNLAVIFGGIPVVAAWISMTSIPNISTRKPVRTDKGEPIHSWGILISVWLGNISICTLLGLMSGVFPKLGVEIGIEAALFGLLMFILGAGRTLIFILSFYQSHIVHNWKLCVISQLTAAILVGTVSLICSIWWLFIVFISIGIALGTTYYRSLYTSLSGGGATGLKSSIHEASLLSGVLIGSVGGGMIAHIWGLRYPYIPIGLLVIILIAVQIILLFFGNRNRAGEKVSPMKSEVKTKIPYTCEEYFYFTGRPLR